MQRACCCETVLRPEKAVDVKDFNIVGVCVLGVGLAVGNEQRKS